MKKRPITKTQRQIREALKAQEEKFFQPFEKLGPEEIQILANYITAKCPGMGFALFMFQFGGYHNTNYISNADRDTMIEAMEETLFRFKANQTDKEVKEIKINN